MKTTSKPRLYFAAPLFSDAERQYNDAVANKLGEVFDVYLPQRDGGLLARMVSTGVPAEIAAERIFAVDMAAIERCRVFLAVLDGRSVDEGVAFELGAAFGLNKLCVGLQTDPRRLLPSGNNPMIMGPLSRIFSSDAELLHWAAAVVEQIARDQVLEEEFRRRGSSVG